MTKEERLKAKIERIKRMFPNPSGAQAKQIEAALKRAEAQLSELPKT